MVNKKCPLFCYLEEFVCLSFANKQEIPTIVMAKIQIKSENPTRFGGIFLIMEQFNSTLSSVIDSTLGQRCKSFGRVFKTYDIFLHGFVEF